MKKLASLFAAFALMLTLAACSKEDTPPEETTPAPETEETDTPTPETTDETEPTETEGLVTEEDTENTGDKTFDAALQELELTK